MNTTIDTKGTPCPGAGSRWTFGMGSAICPVCHLSAVALGCAPRRVNSATGRAVHQALVKSGTVPAHTREEGR